MDMVSTILTSRELRTLIRKSDDSLLLCFAIILLVKDIDGDGDDFDDFDDFGDFDDDDFGDFDDDDFGDFDDDDDDFDCDDLDGDDSGDDDDDFDAYKANKFFLKLILLPNRYVSIFMINIIITIIFIINIIM
jgi:hypothetical protein